MYNSYATVPGYEAHATVNGKDRVITSASNLADLMYNVTHWRENDPEPAIILLGGKSIGTANYGHKTTEGREVIFCFPKLGGRQIIKLSADLDNL